MSGEVIVFLLLLGASVSLAGGSAAAASLVFYVSAKKSPRRQHRETRLPGTLCFIDWILLLMLAPAMITGATLAAPYSDTSVLAVLFILFASVSAWRLIVTRSSLASQRGAPPNSIIKSPSVGCSAAFWPLYWASAPVWLGRRSMVQGGGHE